jgi:drug/metabolite transporter (DMT)-like permease
MTGKKPAGWLVDCSLIGVALIWGATFVIVKQALADVSTLLFLAIRFTLATIALAVIFRTQFRKLDKHSIRGGIMAGVFLFSGYVLQTFGLKYTSASKTGFITCLYIPLVPLFSSLVYKKVPRIPEILGVVSAFIGITLMSVQENILKIGLGEVLVACCAVAYAFHILVLGRFAGSSNSGILAITQIATGAVLAAVTFWWAEPVHIQWTRGVWIALAITSLFATAVAFAVQTWAQRYSSPTRTALIFSMEPVFAWVTSYLVAGEVLSTRGTIGAVLILTGILLVELRWANSGK